jgi:putative DNA primase/helicase
MELKGLRIAFASETDEGRRFSPGQVKWYSGGDTLTGRLPHDKRPTRFGPTHLLILLTNNLPHAPGDDFAFWDRLKLVPFHYSFVASPDPAKPNQKKRNEGLLDKLKGEAPGILALLVNGCLDWQRNGLSPPPIVTSATEIYRINEDVITQFVEECCIVDADSVVKAADLYKAFSTWYSEHIYEKVPKQKKFGEMLSKQFKKDKIGGVVKYYGLELNDEQATL